MLVSTAEDGRIAVDMVACGDYDLVLMDMQMPVMDGLQATENIRKAGYHDLPIVAMTANAFKEDRLRCIDAGMDDFLAKPVDVKELHKILVKWIKQM